jgi:hypothetical protein
MKYSANSFQRFLHLGRLKGASACATGQRASASGAENVVEIENVTRVSDYLVTVTSKRSGKFSFPTFLPSRRMGENSGEPTSYMSMMFCTI